jgi:hypothetical protein
MQMKMESGLDQIGLAEARRRRQEWDQAREGGRHHHWGVRQSCANAQHSGGEDPAQAVDVERVSEDEVNLHGTIAEIWHFLCATS